MYIYKNPHVWVFVFVFVFVLDTVKSAGYYIPYYRVYWLKLSKGNPRPPVGLDRYRKVGYLINLFSFLFLKDIYFNLFVLFYGTFQSMSTDTYFIAHGD